MPWLTPRTGTEELAAVMNDIDAFVEVLRENGELLTSTNMAPTTLALTGQRRGGEAPFGPSLPKEQAALCFPRQPLDTCTGGTGT